MQTHCSFTTFFIFITELWITLICSINKCFSLHFILPEAYFELSLPYEDPSYCQLQWAMWSCSYNNHKWVKISKTMIIIIMIPFGWKLIKTPRCWCYSNVQQIWQHFPLFFIRLLLVQNCHSESSATVNHLISLANQTPAWESDYYDLHIWCGIGFRCPAIMNAPACVSQW